METIQIPFRKTIIHHEPTCHSWTCNSTIQTPLRSTKQFYIMILLHVIHGHVMKVMHKIMVPLNLLLLLLPPPRHRHLPHRHLHHLE